MSLALASGASGLAVFSLRASSCRASIAPTVKPADKMAMERLKSCKWVEEIDGTALFTDSGVEAAMKLASG